MKKAILLLLVVFGLASTILTSCKGDKDRYQYEHTIKKGIFKNELIGNLEGAYKDIYGKDFLYELEKFQENKKETYRITVKPDGVIDFHFESGKLSSYSLIRNDNKSLDWMFKIIKGVEATKAEY
ncbi:MAG: hypothetical protein LBF27_00620 [Sphingobacterium sp.]|jgi:hypothetical protein|nr:hypothetical protein [Sphingobacterium sp.]